MAFMRKITLAASLGFALAFIVGCGDKASSKASSSSGADLSSSAGVSAAAGDTAQPVDDGSTSKKDNDIASYKTVKIGKQVWMAENLNYYVEGSKCYGNNPDNCKKYGRLYTWEAAKTVCPSGWHLPDNKAWQTLITTGGGKVAGKNLKSIEEGNGTDKHGFSALPGGFGDPNGTFHSIGYHGRWWSASADEANNGAYGMVMAAGADEASLLNLGKSGLFSVRCLQD